MVMRYQCQQDVQPVNLSGSSPLGTSRPPDRTAIRPARCRCASRDRAQAISAMCAALGKTLLTTRQPHRDYSRGHRSFPTRGRCQPGSLDRL